MSEGAPKTNVRSRLSLYAPNVLRVVLFATCVLVGITWFVAHRVRAQLGEALMGIGAEMLRYENAERQDAPRTLHLNGQRMGFASGTARQSIGEVLDVYEARCRAHDGQLDEQARERGAALPLFPDGSPVDTVLRDEEGDKGFVACLDLGEDRVEPHDLLARLEQFQESLDLGKIGHLRYVYAEQGDGTTQFVAFWTEGRFEIASMFPERGDAPGTDVDGVPRPPSARRILSAWEDGHPQTMTVYAGGPRGAAELESFYRDAMSDAGWSLLQEPRQRVTQPGMLVYEREDRVVTLVFGRDSQGRATTAVLTAR